MAHTSTARILRLIYTKILNPNKVPTPNNNLEVDTDYSNSIQGSLLQTYKLDSTLVHFNLVRNLKHTKHAQNLPYLSINQTIFLFELNEIRKGKNCADS